MHIKPLKDPINVGSLRQLQHTISLISNNLDAQNKRSLTKIFHVKMVTQHLLCLNQQVSVISSQEYVTYLLSPKTIDQLLKDPINTLQNNNFIETMKHAYQFVLGRKHT